MAHLETLEFLNLLVKKPVFPLAFKYLRPKTELAIIYDHRTEFALFENDHTVLVEERKALADVVFLVNAEALRMLSQHPGDHLAGFGIAVIDQIIAGGIKIKVTGSFLSLTTGGYIKLILAAGPDFLGHLARHGVQGTKKIIEIMRSLKS
ncbi:MAG: hypothetical protein K1X29_00695 [Bdellovibrionales bacterium]|nr:hypothetical protein [Bdellovibrionales bacterium]